MADRISLDDLKPLVESASSRYGVPSEYIWNVIRAENSGSVAGAASLKDASSTAVSPKGAKGIMQVMPIALKDVQQAGLVPSTISHDNLSVEDQINVGTAYLSRLMKLSDKPEEIYAMYNYGPKARFRMDQLPDETKGYVSKATQSESTSTKSGGGPAGTFGGGAFNSGDLISALLGTATQQNQAIQQGSDILTRQMALAQDLFASGNQMQAAAVTQAATNAAEKANIDYKINSTLEGIQRLYGMNPEDQNNEIATSLAAANSAREQYQGARAEYDQLAQTDFLSNPIGYLFAQLKMPTAAAKVNSLADAEERALQNIQDRNALLAGSKSVVTANTADQLRKVQLSQADAELKMAQGKMKTAEAENASRVASQQMQLIQIANMSGDNMRQALTSVIQLQDYQESKELREEQRRQIMEGKRLKEEEDARLNARLKVVSDSLGLLEPMTVQRLSKLTNKKAQEMWLRVAQTGSYGENMEESLKFYLGTGSAPEIIKGGGASTMQAANKLAQTGASYQSSAERAYMAANPTGKKLSPDESRALGYKMYQQEIEASMSSPTEVNDLSSSKWEKTYNPYVAQFVGFNKAIDTLPNYGMLKNNAVKKLVDDIIKTGVQGDNLSTEQQQQVMGAVIEKVRNRELTPAKAAADVAAYFSSAAAYNRELNKYDLFALPQQNAYLYTLEGTSLPGDNRQKTNLMDPKDVENAIIRKAKARTIESVVRFPLLNTPLFNLNQFTEE